MSDIYRLDGKTSLVTGASRGIGAAVARALARQGSDLILTARDTGKLESVAADIRAMGKKARIIPTDLSDADQLSDFLERSELQETDIFVNNAAFTYFKSLLESDMRDFDELVSVNVRSAVSILNKVAKYMIEKKSGSIVIITSINALSALPSQALYSSTKAMLESLMKSAAAELARHGVRVNSVVPGAVMTDMNPQFNDEIIEKVSGQIPAGRIGTPEDIADVVAFVCSDAARFMNGSSIVADGGYLLRQ